MSLLDLIKPNPMRKAAHSLYLTAGEQSRLPLFYTDWQVEDSFDGRYDMLLIHVHLLIRRANGEPRPAPRLAQMLFEVMLKDMDQSLRLSGVGDIGIGHRVKKMSHAYYGRATAYDAALDKGDAQALKDALQRNVYRGREVEPATLDRLSAYVVDNWQALEATPFPTLATGTYLFISPAEENS